MRTVNFSHTRRTTQNSILFTLNTYQRLGGRVGVLVHHLLAQMSVKETKKVSFVLGLVIKNAGRIGVGKK